MQIDKLAVAPTTVNPVRQNLDAEVGAGGRRGVGPRRAVRAGDQHEITDVQVERRQRRAIPR